MYSYGVVVLAALAVSAFAGGYLPGREYHYKYKGDVFHEFSKKVHQHAGFAAEADVFIQPHAGFATVKFKDVVFKQINNRPDDPNRVKAEFKVIPHLQEHLSKPFEIHYDHDIISELKLAKDDPVWSVNMKKALASMLQLNFDRANLVHDKVSRKYDGDKPEFENFNYYKVMEDGLRGECETVYQISSEPEYHYHNNVLNVTKTKNYDNCKTSPYKFFRNHNNQFCKDCSGEINKAAQTGDFYHYNIRGDRHNFIIESLETEEKFTYAPFGYEAEYVKGGSNRTLKLLEEKDVKEEIQTGDDLVTHHDLHYEFEDKDDVKEVADLKKNHYLYDFLPLDGSPEGALLIFNKILESYDDDKPYPDTLKEKNLPMQFNELIYSFARLSYDQIEDFFKTHVDAKDKGWSKDATLTRKWLFLDAVTHSGSSAGFMFIKHLITEVHIPHHVIINYLEQLPIALQEYSKVLLEEFYRLCEHPYVHDNANTRKICYLSFSSLVHTHCVAEYYNVRTRFHNTEPPPCTPKTAAKYFEKMVVHHHEHTIDSHDRITRIKTAGNFGVKESIKYLKRFVYGEELVPNYFRVSAIWALRKVANNYPDEVLSLLTPVYFNTSEPHEIRIAAFTMLIVTSPPLYNIETIAESLSRDPSHQVAHYVMSTFLYLSKMENPCFAKLASNCKKVLHYLDRLYFHVFHDLRHSFIWLSSGIDKKFNLGGSTFVSYVTSNQSYIPHDVYFALGDYLGNKNTYPLEVGYVGYGLDKFFDRLFGPEGFFKQKKSIFDIFKRKTRDVSNVEKELKEIDERLHIQPREQEPILGDVFIRAYGNEINFFHFNESLFESFLKDGVFHIPDVQNGLKDIGKFGVKRFYSGPFFALIVPSAIGIPFYVHIQELIYFHYKNNNFKFQVEPNLFAEERNNDLPSKVTLKVDGHLLVDRLKMILSGAILPSLQIWSSAGIFKRDYNSHPLKFEIAVDPKTPKVEFKTAVIPHTRIHKSFIPFTTIGDDNTVKPGYIKGMDIKPYYKENEVKKVEKEFFHDILGYGIQLKGKFGRLHHMKSWGDFWKFFCETTFREKVYDHVVNPRGIMYDYDIAITPANRDQTNELDFVFTFDHIGFHSNKAYKPAFVTADDGLEDYTKGRSDRKVTTCVVKGELLAKGTKERKLVTELTYSYTLDKLFHKLNFFYDRTPFAPTETENFKVCYSAALKYPTIPMKKLYDLDTLDLDPKIYYNANAHFGKDCETDQKISVRGVLSKSDQQKAMEADRENPESNCPYNTPFAYYYKRCKKDIEKGVHYSVNCRKYWHRITILHKYDLDYTYEKLSPAFLNFTSKFDTWLKHALYYYMDENQLNVDNPANRIHVELKFDAKKPVFDLHIKEPHETEHFDQVPRPYWLKPRSALPIFEFTNLKMYWMYFKVPFCSVEGDNVHTFDYVEYKLPPIDCYKVIAKDCSHKEFFTVLGKKITHNKYKKAVKVFLDKWKIEALPVTEEGEIIVRVDGKKVPVTETEPYFHHQTIKNKDVLLFYVTFNGHYYTLKSEHYGVTVYYDGKAILVHLSPYYRGKQCGLCGDFNNENKGEFRGPENCVYKNITEFSYSYVIPENGCNVPEIKSPCDLQHVAPCTVLRNRYVYVGTRNRQVCFTTVPLPECSPECAESSNKVSRQVGFHCLPAREDFTRFLLRESRQRVLHEVQKKSEDHFEKLDYPQFCHHPSF